MQACPEREHMGLTGQDPAGGQGGGVRDGRVFAAKAVAAGLLLVASAAAVALSQGSAGAPLAALQQLQFAYGMAPTAVSPAYGAYGAMAPAYPGVALPASPTLYRAASAVANARAAVGTAYLRRAYPNVPGIRAAAVMPSYGMAAPAAPLFGGRPPVAAYHVSIPTGAAAPYYPQYGAGPMVPGAPPLVSPVQAPTFAGYGSPAGAVSAYGSYMVPQPPPAQTVRDMAVNAAINAGANAAAVANSPQFVAGAGYTTAMPTAVQGVSVAAPYRTVRTMSSAGAPLAATAVSTAHAVVQTTVPGTETMKIVAGPGKGKIVDVNSAGKIVSSLGGAPAPTALQVPMARAPMSSMSAMSLPALPNMGTVSVETPYTRLSGKEQAEASAVSAGTGSTVAHDALAMTAQGAPPSTAAVDAAAPEADADDASETASADGDGEDAEAASEGAAATANAEEVAKADAAEGDAAKVAVGSKGGERLASGETRQLPQLSLQTHGSDDHARGVQDRGAEAGLEVEQGGEARGENIGHSRQAGASIISPDLTKLRDEAYGTRPQALVRVPAGKRPGDFFSAAVAGRGSMLVEVPDGVRGGDDLQLLQVPTADGEELEWIRYDPKRRQGAREPTGPTGSRALAGVSGDGPDQREIDRQAAARDTVTSAWKLGNRAPRSYFH